MSRDNGRALVVPIDVAALCVTDSDRHTVEFADLAAHFDDLPYFDAAWGYANDRNLPNFAEHVLPKPFDAAAPYESGVHLHWALPDALTHGVSDGTGPMRFPTAPDRWLVMRLESAAAPEASWIIESDHLWDQGDELDDGRVNNDRLLQNAFSRALPLAPFPARTTGKPFCAMGRVFPYVPGRRDAGPSCTLTTTAEKGARTLMVSDASGWGIAGNSVAVIHDGDNTEIVFVKEPPATNAKTLTLVVPTASRHGENCVVDAYLGDRFTALGYGTTAFAAAYPHCPNVFGFWDPVGIDQADLSYLVAGWYSQRRRDCLQKAKFSESTRPELKGRFAADNMAWAFMGSPGGPMPAYTLCAGLIRGIKWNTSKAYLTPRVDDKVDVVIANNTAEALARLLAQREMRDGDKGQFKDVADLELLLEVFQLGLLRQLEELGGPARADEARHAARFGAQQGGTLWVIKPKTDPSPGQPPKPQPPWPDGVADALGKLNDQQQTCDAIAFEVQARRAQIFADWYKYLALQHPGPDLPADLIPLINKAQQFVAAEIDALGSAVNDLRAAQDACTTQKSSIDGLLKNTGYVCTATASARYYQPNEPVLLLSGGSIRPSPRYGTDGDDQPDGNLLCRMVAAPELDTLIAEARTLAAGPAASAPAGVVTWKDEPPWIPLFLQWELALRPYVPVGAKIGAYANEFIGTTYDLHHDGIDLTARGDPPPSSPRSWTGTTVLAARTAIHLGAQVDAFLDANPKDPLATRLAPIADQLDATAMLQTLAGFNDALLMRKQTLQLPVWDSIARSDGLFAFSAVTVAGAVDDQNKTSPEPDLPFNPIRAGELLVRRLRVVDAFGQVLDVNLESRGALYPGVMVARSLRPSDDDERALLPPRLAQPGRLQFRLLSAAPPYVDSNSHPDTSPVCGWVLYNHLDESLMVYDADGVAVGSLNTRGEALWQPAPGNEVASLEGPRKARLKSFVGSVRNAGTLTALLGVIDRTMTTVNPLGTPQDKGLSVLIGQPLALVCASLRLELQGPAALDESWDAFREALQTGTRASANVAGVSFPVRLGDLGSHDDGLIGFYVDDTAGDGSAYDIFYAAAATSGTPAVKTPDPDTLLLQPVAARSDASPLTVAMLLDPRGCVHATTGILPVKEIQVPPALYSRALQQIAVTFLTTPVLRGASLALPLPVEPGYVWQWISRNGAAAWSEPGAIAKPNPQATLEAPRAIDEGWLRLVKESH